MPKTINLILYKLRTRRYNFACRSYRVLIVEKEAFGGQITITAEVVNYPGVGLTDGKTLTQTMRADRKSTR